MAKIIGYEMARQLTCPNCGAIIEYMPSELIYQENVSDIGQGIYCPGCGGWCHEQTYDWITKPYKYNWGSTCTCTTDDSNVNYDTIKVQNSISPVHFFLGKPFLF